jgi:hypothetical protein
MESTALRCLIALTRVLCRSQRAVTTDTRVYGELDARPAGSSNAHRPGAIHAADVPIQQWRTQRRSEPATKCTPVHVDVGVGRIRVQRRSKEVQPVRKLLRLQPGSDDGQRPVRHDIQGGRSVCETRARNTCKRDSPSASKILDVFRRSNGLIGFS